jgi:hypothetical protein
MNVGVKEDLNLFQIYEYVSCPQGVRNSNLLQ